MTTEIKGIIEVLYSGQREGKFQLYCISEVEGGRYVVFTLATEQLMEPRTAPDRETAIRDVEQFFYDTEEA